MANKIEKIQFVNFECFPFWPRTVFASCHRWAIPKNWGA